MRILLILIASAFQLRAGALLIDDFNSAPIDTSNWVVNVPYSDSAVFLDHGEIVFRNGGSLITKTPLSEYSVITGSFRFTGSIWDRFSINLRANGNYRVGSYGTYASDIYVEIQHTGGESGGPIRNVTLSHDGIAHYDQVQYGPFGRFESNTSYSFKIEDTGTTINVFIENFTTPLLSGTSLTRDGYFIAIGNREGAGNGSSISAGSELRIDSITIIPEPSALSLLVFGLGVVLRRRRGTV